MAVKLSRTSVKLLQGAADGYVVRLYHNKHQNYLVEHGYLVERLVGAGSLWDYVPVDGAVMLPILVLTDKGRKYFDRLPHKPYRT